eukprot:365172-Chlamydomonas_euryale.AAC.2
MMVTRFDRRPFSSSSLAVTSLSTTTWRCGVWARGWLEGGRRRLHRRPFSSGSLAVTSHEVGRVNFGKDELAVAYATEWTESTPAHHARTAGCT